MSVLVVGAGSIGSEYVSVLRALDREPLLVTRSTAGADRIRAEHPELEVRDGGLEPYLATNDPPSQAILATPITTLATHCELLIDAGVDRILGEKPLALSAEGARGLHGRAEEAGASVYVAFNRRHYAAVRAAREMVAADGGLTSMVFDVTEAVWRIDPEEHDDEVLSRWGIANTSHVIDTAFHLGGDPKTIDTHQEGDAVDWHRSGSIFQGRGRTPEDVPFSYHSDWGAPGRWRLELNTSERKFVLEPMERLQIQPRGSFELEEAEVDYAIDEEFKPGFYRQIGAFLGDGDGLMGLRELPDRLAVIERIFGY